MGEGCFLAGEGGVAEVGVATEAAVAEVEVYESGSNEVEVIEGPFADLRATVSA
jgi:transcription antitermination factor NusG